MIIVCLIVLFLSDIPEKCNIYNLIYCNNIIKFNLYYLKLLIEILILTAIGSIICTILIFKYDNNDDSHN